MRSSAAATRASSATGSLSPCASCTQPLDPRIQLAPLRDESRLPVTRRSRNQHHPAALRDLLQRSEAGPRYRIGPHRRNQYRRRFQQAPTLERRRRTSDSSGLPPCGRAILRHACRCRQAPRPERRESSRRLWISRCESSITATVSRLSPAGAPGDVRARDGFRARISASLADERSAAAGVAFGAWPASRERPAREHLARRFI